MRVKLLLLTLAFSFTALVASAKMTPPPGNGGETSNKKVDIAGGVVSADTKRPLSNVNVVAYTNSKKEKAASTDQYGNYYFNDLKPGTYKLVFQKDGYKKVTKDKVVIRSDEGCQLNIEMEEADEFQIMPGLLFTDLN